MLLKSTICLKIGFLNLLGKKSQLMVHHLFPGFSHCLIVFKYRKGRSINLTSADDF